jgi:hypothetical protein
MDKTISILGTGNRFLMKKVMKVNEENKKRVCSLSLDWNSRNQLDVLTECDDVTRREIEKKLSGYKQQDLKKDRYNNAEFITLDYVTDMMKQCELKCRYCSCELYILYDNVREKRQWTIDRIDNTIGHNVGNVHLACLGCNLKRRNMSDAKFDFTKNLTIVKME